MSWPAPQIEVVFRSNADAPSAPNGTCEFTVQDSTVGFRAVGELFMWQRDYDIESHRSLYYGGRRGGTMTVDEAIGSCEKFVREYYQGDIDFGSLEFRMRLFLMSDLPIVKNSRPGTEAPT
jgi:hypothetical protein